ncbi:protein-glutamate O-methyltransferase CheR [Clostridium sp. KNHs216]|jgi:Methylase of chemotaxis methyl-accepting proteins|uniref:CheR family methyltransferase n=1 Tax=Eubacteriales TaxID=186802 RepID=UPI000570C7AB|nr:protein-glutamate O-methyltransferase CheR [Clostridium sp. KNHs216]TQI65479.1 chemotaxis protein methyltransferase CheR [Clostridium sp. KNHs216]
MIRLTDKEFNDIVAYIKGNYGINLTNKRQLIESRMQSILLGKGIDNFSDYFDLIKQNKSDEITAMLNKLTTNHTYFYREPAHFNFLKNTILPMQEKTNARRDIRIWSAGCSSGEEAYTAIMTMMDYFGLKRAGWDFRILATDISLKAMEAAKHGLYGTESLKDIPKTWEQRYFIKRGENLFELKEEVRNQVFFKRLNLMEPFSFQQPFDLIFCRNVMIYFDQPTKNALINKFYDVLKPGGYLFIGHSETVQRDTSKFLYIEPSVYQKGSVSICR